MTEELPKIDLSTFLLSISSAAMMGMGLIPDPEGNTVLELSMAKQNIDLLELMAEKTQGNRTPEEDKLLEQLLFELRMKYVEVNKE